MMNLRITFLAVAAMCSYIVAYSQSIRKSFDFQGETREYLVHLPNSFDSTRAYPVVIAYHGFGDNITNFSAIGFNQLANAEGFIVVYPAGLPMTIPLLGTVSAWRIGTPLDGNIDDVAFSNALIDTLIANYYVDTNRVYATGFSMGGFLCYRLACELSNRIAAIASNSGTLQSTTASTCNPGRSIPIMHVHGTSDTKIGYDGGGLFAAALQFETVDNIIDKWVGLNECMGAPDSIRMPDIKNDGFTVDRFSYTDCADSSEILLFRVNGADHEWMYHKDINATDEIWNFFKRHKKREPQPTAVTEIARSSQVYPNPFGNFLNIDLGSGEMSRLSICDLFGKEMLNKTLANDVFRGEVTLQTKYLPAGIYFLKLENAHDIYVHKIVKH